MRVSGSPSCQACESGSFSSIFPIRSPHQYLPDLSAQTVPCFVAFLANISPLFAAESASSGAIWSRNLKKAPGSEIVFQDKKDTEKKNDPPFVSLRSPLPPEGEAREINFPLGGASTNASRPLHKGGKAGSGDRKLAPIRAKNPRRPMTARVFVCVRIISRNPRPWSPGGRGP